MRDLYNEASIQAKVPKKQQCGRNKSSYLNKSACLGIPQIKPKGKINVEKLITIKTWKYFNQIRSTITSQN
jgi:hypothetical protein